MLLRKLATLFLSIVISICALFLSSEKRIAEAYGNEQYYSTIYGQVVHIADGDTVTVQTKDGYKFKVRMYGIDAPEKAQPYGPQSTGILRQLIGNQYVEVSVLDTDRYGRKVSKIYLNHQDINAEMINLGAAWHYRYYDKSSDYDRYEQLEWNARNNSRGLWNKPNPMPPWEFRKMMRAQGKM